MVWRLQPVCHDSTLALRPLALSFLNIKCRRWARLTNCPFQPSRITTTELPTSVSSVRQTFSSLTSIVVFVVVISNFVLWGFYGFEVLGLPVFVEFLITDWLFSLIYVTS